MADLNEHDVPSEVEPADWSLLVTGLVREPLALSSVDLRSFPLERYTGDFVCEEGWIAEDLTWRGIPVDAILSRAGPSRDGQYGLVSAMDGLYACSFPVEILRKSLLAIELDGERLPTEHGGPARLVPTYLGRNCWESVKWVTEIEIAEEKPSQRDTAKEVALSRIE